VCSKQLTPRLLRLAQAPAPTQQMQRLWRVCVHRLPLEGFCGAGEREFVKDCGFVRACLELPRGSHVVLVLHVVGTKICPHLKWWSALPHAVSQTATVKKMAEAGC
jgi:hypothetical protein